MAALICLGVLLAVLLGLPLLYDRFWEKGLGCEIKFTQDYAVEDETSALSEVITNRNLLPLPVLEISFHMDRRLRFGAGENASLSDQTYRRDVFAASMRQKITRTLEFQCAGRGYFRINEAGISARDLFLTRNYLSSRPQNTEFYVLPRPVPTAQIQIPYSRIMGAVLSRKRVCEDPFEFGGLREYARGDPMKYINWKATARAGKLLTNLHESTMSQKVVMAIDMEGGGPQGDFLTECAVRAACSLAERLLFEGVELSLYSNGQDVQTGGAWKLEGVAGAGSSLYLKKKMACLLLGADLPPVCGFLPPNPGPEDLLVLVSRNQRPQLAEDFARAVGRGQGVRVVPCGAEHGELPEFARVDLVWMEF